MSKTAGNPTGRPTPKAPPAGDGPYDERGWFEGLVRPLALDAAWHVLSPEPSSRLDETRLATHALTFFQTALSVSPRKAYDAGEPVADVAVLELHPAGEPAPVRALVQTLPLGRADEVVRAAMDSVGRVGDGGMSATAVRAKRLWQVRSAPGAPPYAGLLGATLLSSVLLGPVLPPDERTLFGPKSGRLRLEKLGVRFQRKQPKG